MGFNIHILGREFSQAPPRGRPVARENSMSDVLWRRIVRVFEIGNLVGASRGRWGRMGEGV